MSELSQRFEAFVIALEDLCLRYEVTLAVGDGYELEVWNADQELGPIHCTAVLDRLG